MCPQHETGAVGQVILGTLLGIEFHREGASLLCCLNQHNSKAATSQGETFPRGRGQQSHLKPVFEATVGEEEGRRPHSRPWNVSCYLFPSVPKMLFFTCRWHNLWVGSLGSMTSTSVEIKVQVSLLHEGHGGGGIWLLYGRGRHPSLNPVPLRSQSQLILLCDGKVGPGNFPCRQWGLRFRGAEGGWEEGQQGGTLGKAH